MFSSLAICPQYRPAVSVFRIITEAPYGWLLALLACCADGTQPSQCQAKKREVSGKKQFPNLSLLICFHPTEEMSPEATATNEGWRYGGYNVTVPGPLSCVWRTMKNAFLFLRLGLVLVVIVKDGLWDWVE